jgi:hypothetical protein
VTTAPWLRLLLVPVMLVLGACSTVRAPDGPATPIPGQQESISSPGSTPAVAPTRFADPVLTAFYGRVELTRKTNLPIILASAQSAATKMLDHPNACINVPYGLQSTFAEEILNRAGGLANALPPEERPKETTPNDILLVSVRSWSADEANARKMIENGKKSGWQIVLFAPKAGLPKDLTPDFLIDNGGSVGPTDQPAINSVANIMNVWIWCAEYASALTRDGKYPGVLYSVAMSGADEHNKKIQTPEGRHFLGNTRTSVPKGTLATLYLASVDQLLVKLGGTETQRQVEAASTAIAKEIKEGHSVIVASCTHFLMGEVFLDRQSPMKPLHVVWRAKKAFADNARPDDVVFWIGYIGMSTKYEKYFDAITSTGAKLVSSYVSDNDPANNASNRLAHIEQHWSPPDAELAAPFAPGFMAPVSGIDQGLIFRMVDQRVAQKLK